MIASRVRRMFWLLASTVTLLGFAEPAAAVETGMSPWPKGFEGFMSGVLPPEAGFYNTKVYYYFSGTAGQVVRDGRVELGVDVTMNAGFVYPLVVTDLHFLGGQYAFGGAFDWAGADLSGSLSTPLGNKAFDVSNNSVGDTIIVPAILGWHDGLFNWSLALNVYVPTGPYASALQNLQSGTLNIGRNIWAFMPQYAITYFNPQTGWDVSGSFVYVTMSNNSSTNYQSGDLVQLDWAVGKHFGPGGAWEAGVAGNVVEQVGSDRGSGALLGPFKAQSIGVGPALNYSTKLATVPVVFSAKWERDVQARNTFKGDVVNASATFVF
jgi:hypothetical protein